eukprot:142416-Rhodomonas_salina.1
MRLCVSLSLDVSRSYESVIFIRPGSAGVDGVCWYTPRSSDADGVSWYRMHQACGGKTAYSPRNSARSCKSVAKRRSVSPGTPLRVGRDLLFA